MGNLKWDPDLIVIGLTIGGVFVLAPLARALGRRLERRSGLPSGTEVLTRLERIEQAVDSIAVEVERISEAQRYTTRLLANSDRTKAESVQP